MCICLLCSRFGQLQKLFLDTMNVPKPEANMDPSQGHIPPIITGDTRGGPAEVAVVSK